MKSNLLKKLVSGLGVALSVITVAAQAQTLPQVGLLVPAYFYPGTDSTDWNRLSIAATQVPVMAVMNPNSGPGKAPDSNYTAAITSFDAAGGSTLGYIHTSYGYRSLAAVEKEVSEYFAWYPIDGIFIDEMASTATPKALKYYKAVKDYIRSVYPAAIIVANPGTSFDQAFATTKVADIFVDEEDTETNVNATTQSAWEQGQPATLFAEIAVQSSDDAQEATFLASRHLAWVYSTALALNPDPYAALPADFEQEVAALVSVNGLR